MYSQRSFECRPSRPVSYKKRGQMCRLKGPGAWWQSDCQQLSKDQIFPSSFDQTMELILQRSLQGAVCSAHAQP